MLQIKHPVTEIKIRRQLTRAELLVAKERILPLPLRRGRSQLILPATPDAINIDSLSSIHLLSFASIVPSDHIFIDIFVEKGMLPYVDPGFQSAFRSQEV